jgi:hypothetical protein
VVTPPVEESVNVTARGAPPVVGVPVNWATGAIEGFTVRLEDRVTPLYTAEMITAVELDTETVVTANAVLALPPGTVTVAGTVATEVLPLDSDTTAPPAGAGPLSVTVPVELLPPATEDGLRDRETSAAGGGSTVRGDDWVTPLYTAEMVTAVELGTWKGRLLLNANAFAEVCSSKVASIVYQAVPPGEGSEAVPVVAPAAVVVSSVHGPAAEGPVYIL